MNCDKQLSSSCLKLSCSEPSSSINSRHPLAQRRNVRARTEEHFAEYSLFKEMECYVLWLILFGLKWFITQQHSKTLNACTVSSPLDFPSSSMVPHSSWSPLCCVFCFILSGQLPRRSSLDPPVTFICSLLQPISCLSSLSAIRPAVRIIQSHQHPLPANLNHWSPT